MTNHVFSENVDYTIYKTGTSNFAGPGGVTITHNLNLSDYSPSITPLVNGSGSFGEIWVTDIAVNSFVVRNSGIAITEFTWTIHVRT